MIKKSCWRCGSKQVICWGKRNNHQRYKCKECDLLFQWDNKAVRNTNRFIWFKKLLKMLQIKKSPKIFELFLNKMILLRLPPAAAIAIAERPSVVIAACSRFFFTRSCNSNTDSSSFYNTAI